jgi:O-antigen ligase
MPAVAAPKKIPASQPASVLFASAAGVFFFLVIIKFGDPVIMDYNAAAPSGVAELIFGSWPSRWGLWLAGPLVVIGLLTAPWERLRGSWVLLLPALWLGWEFLAGTQTIDRFLTAVTLKHFTICVVLFYLGYLVLAPGATSWPLWTGLALGMCWLIRAGFEQHFGGLEATRKLINSGQLISGLAPDVVRDPEFQRRIARDRIFATFWNANALAGALLLLLPLSLVFLWGLTPKVRLVLRLGFVLVLGGCGVACLYWTGSKAGWLIALVLGLAALGHTALPLRWKWWLIGGLLVVGMAGFAIKYASFFQKERNSVGARFGYWRGARIIMEAHPVWGTGPGTFQTPFALVKRPTDEMSRLVHNDYLEQGCDSGVFGLISYTFVIVSFLYFLYRYRFRQRAVNWLYFAIWIGLLGLCLQSAVDCHLYVPALSWPMFFFLGWLNNR